MPSSILFVTNATKIESTKFLRPNQKNWTYFDFSIVHLTTIPPQFRHSSSVQSFVLEYNHENPIVELRSRNQAEDQVEIKSIQEETQVKPSIKIE